MDCCTTNMEILQRIQRAARRLEIDGDPWPDFPPKAKTLEDLQTVNNLLCAVPFFQLSTRQQQFAKQRALSIVMTDSRRAAAIAKRVETEATIRAKAVDAAQRLGLDGDTETQHEWSDLTDDAQRVAARMLDDFLEAGRLPRDLASHARRLSCSLAGSSTEERITAAVKRLRMLPDPLNGTDADAEAAEVKWRGGERLKPQSEIISAARRRVGARR